MASPHPALRGPIAAAGWVSDFSLESGRSHGETDQSEPTLATKLEALDSAVDLCSRSLPTDGDAGLAGSKGLLWTPPSSLLQQTASASSSRAGSSSDGEVCTKPEKKELFDEISMVQVRSSRR